MRFLAPRLGDVTETINIVGPEGAEAHRVLANADIIINQIFDKPGEINVVSEFKSHRIINFPNVYALFYWPFANQRHPRNDEVGTGYDVGPYPNEMGDSFLNRLILSKTPADEALTQYLLQDVASRADRLFEVNAGLQRQRDAASGFDVQAQIERYFQSEQLFLTSAHPKMRIFSYLAEGVMAQLGYSRTDIADALAAQRIAPFPRLALPIHPNIIRHFGLTFVTEETRYPYFEEGDFTFDEYVRRYMNFEWNKELQDAMQVAAGDPDTVLPALDAALRASPRSASGNRVKADLLIRKREFASAKEAATLATELGPDDPRTWLTLCRARRLAGELDEAAAALDQAAVVAPRDAEARIEAAYLAGDRGLWSAAVQEAQRAVDIEPSAARFHSALSDFLARDGRIAESIEPARQAVELDPDAMAYRLILADRLDQDGQADEALTIVREVAARGSRDPHDHARLGHFLARHDDFAAAIAAYRQAIALLPTHPGFRLALTDVLDRSGDRPAAIAELRAVIESADDPHAYAKLGHWLAQDGDFSGAEAAFRHAIELAPAQPGFRLVLADALDSKGESAEAVAIARALIAEGSRDAHLRARLGHFLLRTGDIKGAEAALQEAIEIDPKTIHYRVELADVIERDGRVQEAVAILQALTAEDGRDAKLHGRLGQFLLAMDNLDGAEAAFRAAVEIAPGEAIFQRGLADLVARKEQPKARTAGAPATPANAVDERGATGRVSKTVMESARAGGKADEITGRSRLIRVGEGLSVLNFGRSEARARMVSGFALPATQILPAAGQSTSVTIIDGKTWLGADGGSLIVRAAAGGGILLATTYGATDDATLPPVKVVHLAQLPATDLPFAPSPEVAEPPGREIPGELVLHIERQGDRLFPAGEWAGSPAERLRIEGFAIRPLEAISPGHIEYMGFGPGGRQTPWVTDVKLCGTRGRGYPLTGFAVRLAPALRNQFDVIYEGHFFESGVKGPLRNGEPCLPSIADDPLGAIRLRVVERAGA